MEKQIIAKQLMKIAQELIASYSLEDYHDSHGYYDEYECGARWGEWSSEFLVQEDIKIKINGKEIQKPALFVNAEYSWKGKMVEDGDGCITYQTLDIDEVQLTNIESISICIAPEYSEIEIKNNDIIELESNEQFFRNTKFKGTFKQLENLIEKLMENYDDILQILYNQYQAGSLDY